jgi:hypothetical protein
VTHELIGAWRAEIETELAEAHAALNDARNEFAAETEAAATAACECRAITSVLGRLDPRVGLAHALGMRVTDRQDAARRAAGRASMAEANVMNASRRIDDLNHALEQLAKLIPAEVVE